MIKAGMPLCCDYYRLTSLSLDSTKQEIEDRLGSIEHRLNEHEMPYFGALFYVLHFTIEEFRSKVQEARVILLNDHKRDRYDGMHSKIEEMWDRFLEPFSDWNQNDVDTMLYEIITESILDEATGPQPRDPPTGGTSYNTTSMMSGGEEGCHSCLEGVKNANRLYKRCFECKYSMHALCWRQWASTFAKGGSRVTCAGCRRVVLD